MSILIIVICGAIVGFILSNIRGTRLVWWKNLYLGAAGSIFSSSLMAFGYIVNVIPRGQSLGLSAQSILVNALGAMALIYIAGLFKKINFVL